MASHINKLTEAIIACDFRTVEESIDLIHAEGDKQTLAITASKHHSSECLNILLKNHDYTEVFLNNLLYTVCDNGDEEAVNTLLTAGVNPGFNNSVCSKVAASHGHLHIVKLLTTSYDASMVDAAITLIMAVTNNHYNTVKFLTTKYQYNLNTYNEAIDLAKHKKYNGVVRYLTMTRPTEPVINPPVNEDALMKAIRIGNIASVKNQINTLSSVALLTMYRKYAMTRKAAGMVVVINKRLAAIK